MRRTTLDLFQSDLDDMERQCSAMGGSTLDDGDSTTSILGASIHAGRRIHPGTYDRRVSITPGTRAPVLSSTLESPATENSGTHE